MEVNTRLQVEHGVTELVGNIWIEAGTEVTPYYDPLLAKVLVHGRDRSAAISQLKTTLELWKIGQLKPGDKVRFQPISIERANALELAQDREIELLVSQSRSPQEYYLPETVAIAGNNQTIYRRSGDRYLLIEYGELVLDLQLRFRIHALMEWLKANPIEGVIDLTPGIRSLQTHYDSRILLERQAIEPEISIPTPTLDLPPDSQPITAHLTANVWQVLVKPGDILVILEAMKMEMNIEADEAGAIEAVYCNPGQMVSTGQVLIALKPN